MVSPLLVHPNEAREWWLDNHELSELQTTFDDLNFGVPHSLAVMHAVVHGLQQPVP